MAASTTAASQGGHVIDANGLNFYYEVHGQGKPLLLLHAGSLTGDMWQPYLAGFVTRETGAQSRVSSGGLQEPRPSRHWCCEPVC